MIGNVPRRRAAQGVVIGCDAIAPISCVDVGEPWLHRQQRREENQDFASRQLVSQLSARLAEESAMYDGDRGKDRSERLRCWLR
jgi:hypothetical protein